VEVSDRHRRAAVVALSAFAIALTSPLGAAAHWSDPSTLTLDLIMGLSGLEKIEAADQASTYDRRPSEQQRRVDAGQVLVALGIRSEDADIDPAMSERYHEVGFTITLHQPFATGTMHGELALQSERLQQIGTTNDQRVKLEVCPVDANPALELIVNADHPGRPPNRNATEREDCEIWVLGTTDPPVSIRVSARAVPPATVKPPPPVTVNPPGARDGLRLISVLSAAGAVTLIAAGGLLGFRKRRTWPKHRS
jgi:hypothetical protein